MITTCISSHKLGEPEPLFDMTIMDEASQCNVAVSLVPIIRGEKLMLVGDPQQLKPVILLDELTNRKLRRKYHVADEYDYRENSIYKTYLACDAVSDEILLRNHYRCNKKIIDFNNKKYMNDKALIKSYQIWQFSRSTISQVENIYDSIINPQQNASGDKIAQLMFMEKLFGMCNISYMLEKDYTADQCRENLDTMHELKKLGYSRLHRLIIDKIDASEIYECIHDYILPICKECIGICISNCFKSIFDNEGSLRKDYLEKIKFYRSKCLSELKNTEFLNPSVKYNITNKNLKDQQLTDLFKMMQGYDSKEYSYIKSLEFNSMADYDECGIYSTQATFVESEFKLYSDDYDFQHDGYIYNISAVGLTFDENIDCEYDSYIISELLDDFNPEVDLKTKRVIY